MSLSLRGELTEETETTFSHPKAELNTRLSALSALAYAITDQNHDEIRMILKETKDFLLNQFDYLGNTPVVSPSNPAFTCSSPFPVRQNTWLGTFLVRP